MTTEIVKPKKKIKSLDDFAAAIHEDYQALSKEVKTIGQNLNALTEHVEGITGEIGVLKKDVAYLRTEMRAGFKEVHEDIKLINEIMVSKADLEALREELLIEIRDGKTTEEIQRRLTVVEEKLGIEPNGQMA